MIKWVLRNPRNNKISKMADRKKWLIREVSQRQYSNKEIKKMRKGDIVKVKYTNTYEKWVKSGDIPGVNVAEMDARDVVKREVTETSYKEYILDSVRVSST
jgi:hypothetical protein